ncbi:DcaP family trimeric outer membrane transporter [Acinetobacter sp. ANC 4648]|uniref:DcaP family trimeric outer membrane transporter n=1 Tax=Acinetobacter sp. ANC 4648 TaxID=1977875 RepID=UPI000A330FE4|nr:DcaP family trimeric outer membrane transporter [Acinetobacter sp. ANC 4648]OTG83814.1 DcaP-like protein [Acinetobacter sp. ANC 4648]
MSLFLSRKSFIQQGLAVAVTAMMMTSANAATDKEEIQKLREEVQGLKSLIQQQQNVQQKQQILIEEVKLQPVQVNVASIKPSLLSKAGASVNLYGFVRADAEYQFKGGNGIFNRINTVDKLASNEDRFYSTATTSRIGLDFTAPVTDAKVGGKIEIDFRGSGDTVRIRHAYLNYNNWLIGQTTSSFLSTETQPEMLDFNAPLGIGTFRTPMVRYSDKINATTQYQVGLEQGRADNRFPAATGKVSHKFADGSGLITARALIQEVRAREGLVILDPVTKKESGYNSAYDDTSFGWGVGLGANYKLSEQLLLNADYSHVKGDDKFLLYTDSAYTANAAKTDIKLNEFNAVTVGATYKINPKLRSTLGYGAIFYDDVAKTQNDTLQQGWLNVMYNPTKPVTLGAEYVYGERELGNGDIGGRDSRLGVMAKYDF